jgi:two-component system cell cycle sensor histidine kinase/response regulator CckA
MNEKSAMRLLLVEDNPGDARLFREMLHELGSHDTELMHVETMSQAEKHLVKHAVDVVLLDLGLPDVQGLGAVRRVRAAAPGVPLVVLTGLDDELLAVRALREGAQDYLVKGQIEARGLQRAIRYSVERKHAEEELRENESRYRALAEGSPLAIFVSHKGKVVLANLACMKLFGASLPEDLIGKLALELFHPDSQGLVRERIREDSETVPLVEVRIVRLDGTPVDVEATASPMLDKGVNAIQVVLGDISARKAAEQHLAQSDVRYRGLLEAAPDAMVVVNGAGEIILLNLQAEKQFGYDRDELIGQPVKVIIPEGFAERLVADDLRSAADALAQQIETGIELVGRRKDASEFPIEIMLSPLDSAEGILVTAAIRDISVRKAAEEDLRRTAQLLEASQAVARVGGWELDVMHDSLFWTAETYLIHETSPAEYSPTVATGIGFYAPESIPVITAAVQDAIERGAPFDLDLELITAIGRRISVRAAGVATTEQGRTTKVTGAFQDITDRKLLQAQLNQAQRLEAVGQLAGGIAHDFNNLLTAIRGYAELARRGLEEGERRRGDLDQVIANADRAVALIRQLLAFSRRQVLQPKVLDAGTIVEGVAPLLRRLLGEHVELATSMAAGLGRVNVDPGQLERVVVNLAVNAADAMPDGGKLTIDLSNAELDAAYVAAHVDAVSGPYVLLAVSDTGTGMDAETRRHIFEPFFTTKEVGKGTGMGLATVYGIVRQSGGSINVYSEPGYGTTFRIYLPQVAQEPSEAVVEALAARPSSFGTETILLAEDEPAVRGFARRTLEEYGYTVLEAAGGAEALAIAASHGGPIALLVTDVVMPGLQGHQLAEQLAAARPELRILYVSGFTQHSAIHHGVPEGGVAFLAKPFTIDALGESVRAVLDRPPS